MSSHFGACLSYSVYSCFTIKVTGTITAEFISALCVLYPFSVNMLRYTLTHSGPSARQLSAANSACSLCTIFLTVVSVL